MELKDIRPGDHVRLSHKEPIIDVVVHKVDDYGVSGASGTWINTGDYDIELLNHHEPANYSMWQMKEYPYRVYVYKELTDMYLDVDKGVFTGAERMVATELEPFNPEVE